MASSIYDPSTDTWETVSNKHINHSFDGAKVFTLDDGRAIVFGDLMRSIIYDPATDTWAPDPDPYYDGPALIQAYAVQKMADGRFLACGGFIVDIYTAEDRAWIFDPADQSWTEVASLNKGRTSPTLTLLSDGKLIAIGGRAISPYEAPTATAEVYDPDLDTWEYTGTLNLARNNHQAALLPTGEVLVTGGHDVVNIHQTCERYRPATNDFITGDDVNPERVLGGLLVVPDPTQWTAMVAGGTNLSGFVDDVQLLTPGAGGGGVVGGPAGDGGESLIGSGAPAISFVDIFNFSGTPQISWNQPNIINQTGFARFHIHFSENVLTASIAGKFSISGGITFNTIHYSPDTVELQATTFMGVGTYTITIAAGLQKASDSSNFVVLPTFRTFTFA